MGTEPASFAILRLSVQVWTADASPAIRLVRVASRPPYNPIASASYTSALAPRENPFVPNYYSFHSFHSIVQAVPIPNIFLALPSFYDLSVQTTISSKLRLLSHRLKFSAAFFLSAVSPVTVIYSMAPPNNCCS